ncbi:MAG: hypothetical protein ICV87_05035 [Gemmatimonadetes bacterium]|nr:hypothetical protein [Gemmatimonadota bacterium]
MRYDREFRIKGMPYRYFLSDVVWSAVLVAITGVLFLEMGASMGIAGAAAGVVALAMGKVLYGRVVRERAKHGVAHRPRMARLMERYGAPRRQGAARSTA